MLFVEKLKDFPILKDTKARKLHPAPRSYVFANVKRSCSCRLKMSPINVKLELHFNGEILSTADDRKLVGQIPFKDRTVR